ncbi:hypothetical protein OHC98_26750 [Escherichia coli]|nr:hypothetical protein [Escherichia coli]
MLAVAPGERWHGFNDADAKSYVSRSVKVTILTPGMDEQGKKGNMSEEDRRRWWQNSSTNDGIVMKNRPL